MTINLLHGDCLELIKDIPDDSVDAIIADPPYMYLDHKLDRHFDPKNFFAECYRVLKKDSFLVFFGRGRSFYQWNVICDDIGFKFKEEIIWYKRQGSGPFTGLARHHETIAVLVKGAKVLNKTSMGYTDLRQGLEEYESIGSLRRSISHLMEIITNEAKWDIVQNYLKRGITPSEVPKLPPKGDTIFKVDSSPPRWFETVKTLRDGLRRGRSVVSFVPHNRQKLKTEKQHATAKPVKLMQFLVELVSDKNMVILDPFIGSGTTGVACKELGRSFIGMEIDDQYFLAAKNRIDNCINTPRQETLFNEQF